MRYLIAALFLLLATGWAVSVWAQSVEDGRQAYTVVAALPNHAGASVTDVYTRAELTQQKRTVVERLGQLNAGTTEEPGAAAKVV